MLCKNNNLVYFNFKTITVTHETTLAHYVFIIIVTGFNFYGRRYVCKDRPLFYAAVISFFIKPPYNSRKLYILPLLFIYFFFFLSFFSSATLGAQWTKVNQTLPHIGTWARFANTRPKFAEIGCPKTAYLGRLSTTSRLNCEYIPNKTR